MIPNFNDQGGLPSGIYPVTLAEIAERFANNPARLALFEGLKGGLQNLQAAGVRRIFVDGSFVTTKPIPADIDGCWESGEHVEVDKLDPVWLDFSHSRAAMKQKYGLDFFPHFGIEAGSGKPFVEFFQTSRNGTQRGILVVDLEVEGTDND